jgi:hypothetical protein
MSSGRSSVSWLWAIPFLLVSLFLETLSTPTFYFGVLVYSLASSGAAARILWLSGKSDKRSAVRMVRGFCWCLVTLVWIDFGSRIGPATTQLRKLQCGSTSPHPCFPWWQKGS